MKTTTPAPVERVHPPRWLITHCVNPVARRMLRHDGRLSDEIVLLRFDGRKTGTAYEVPVSYRRIDGRLALFTESGWRHNFRDGRSAEITLHGEAVGVIATLEDDPEAVAAVCAGMIEELGRDEAARRLGIKLHVDRAPTLDELAEMVRTSGLSIVWLDPAVDREPVPT